MEIKSINGVVNIYNQMKVSADKTKAAKAEKKTDKIEFNFARSVEAAKADLSAAINEDLSAQRTEEISSAVNRGEYEVSPEEIAQAILMF